MGEAVIFGAGNIGRSFIGNIFSSNGLSITFIDTNSALIDELNLKKQYRILIKRSVRADEELIVRNFKAIHNSETEKIIECLIKSDICATSVGQAALPKIIPLLAESIKRRLPGTCHPLDIVIAENIRNGSDFFRRIFRENGLLGTEAGLIETSIGKMVPLMNQGDLADDPLVLHAEEYNTLILDGRGFKNMIPDFPEIKAVENIHAWVDRKLFIHNLGHAAAAYLGFERYPQKRLIAEVLEDDQIKQLVRQTMAQAARALLMEYPADFTKQDLADHIDDLISRFQNRALGDTVFRVGRDLQRKLGRNDRILGAAGLCLKHNLPCEKIINVFYSAFKFDPSDEMEEPYNMDSDFLKSAAVMGIQKLLTELCGLDPNTDRYFIKIVLEQSGTG